jgi:FAD/FMN-containing dehydrogenase
VTELEFRLHPVDPMAHLGFFFWRAEDAAGPLPGVLEDLLALPESIGAVVAGLPAPPLPFVPPQHQGAWGVAVLVAGWGDADAHAAAIAPLRGRGAVVEFAMPLPYAALQQMLDEANPWGVLAYDKGITLDDLSPEAVGTYLDWLSRASSPMSYAPMFPLRGRYREVPDEATAFGSPRGAKWALSIIAMSPVEAEDAFATDRAWARGFWDAMRPFAPSAATYVNFEADADEARVRASYGEEKYRRLAALKAVWDPDNVFHHNANIKPAAGIPPPRAASEAAVPQHSGPQA